MSIFRKLQLLRWGMLLLNFLVVLTYSGAAVYSVGFATSHNLALELLGNLELVPGNPVKIFFTVIILYLVLSYLLLYGLSGYIQDWARRKSEEILNTDTNAAVDHSTSALKTAADEEQPSKELAGMPIHRPEESTRKSIEAIPESDLSQSESIMIQKKTCHGQARLHAKYDSMLRHLVAWILSIKGQKWETCKIWLQAAVVVLVLAVIYKLDAVYNGLILMTFCFFLPGEKTVKAPWRTISLCIALYILTQYDVLSVLLPIGNFQAYIDILPRTLQRSLNMTFSLGGSVNLICFLSYISIFLLDQYQRAQTVEQELEMVTEVNSELQSYAAITEKIGEDKERKRIAREIHDTLGHALTGIAAGIDACLVLIDIDSSAAKKQLEIVSRVVRQGIGDVRNSLNKLRPGALEDSSFRKALEKMIHEFMDVSNLQINFDYRLEEFDFDVTKEDMLFRIVQESITNALRHGHAREIWISMYSDEDRIIMSIRDNGIGCDTVTPGYGLTQMKERVGMMGGAIYHDGTQGFLTVVNLPVEKGESQERDRK